MQRAEAASAEDKVTLHALLGLNSTALSDLTTAVAA